MSQENVEVVRRMQAAYVRGEYATSIEALDPRVELWADPEAYPDAGTFRGREAVVRWWTDFVSTFDDYWSVSDELIDAGEWVVTIMHSGGRGRQSGAPVEQSWTSALRVRDGKVDRIEFHADRETALEAVGLSE